MGEMIGMIAHQWRQPLTGMGMSINNLLLDIELQDVDEKRSQESLELINKQIAYLSTTIDDFKNFFKPGIEAETVNVAKLVRESCMIIDSSIKSSSVEIKLNISDDLTILTKKNDVTQIILNLVKNSMDAYEENKIENKIIEISAVDKPKRVEIIIKDYAGGIPKEIIDKIFDPYFSTKGKKNGTGLGLYMSKMIAEDHLCGYLDVETKGSSTTFKIELIKKGV
jgi:C4-dicarboxylate-specific signal transduction histidine kinase